MSFLRSSPADGQRLSRIKVFPSSQGLSIGNAAVESGRVQRDVVPLMVHFLPLIQWIGGGQ
jgi:hypothetical protein